MPDQYDNCRVIPNGPLAATDLCSGREDDGVKPRSSYGRGHSWLVLLFLVSFQSIHCSPDSPPAAGRTDTSGSEMERGALPRAASKESVERLRIENTKIGQVVTASGETRLAGQVTSPFASRVCYAPASTTDPRSLELGARSESANIVLRLAGPSRKVAELPLTEQWSDLRLEVPHTAGCVSIELMGDPGAEGDISRPLLLHAASRRPWVLLYVVDTLRADFASLAPSAPGAPEALPALARLAEDGIVYRRAFAASSWTRPTVATLLTGLSPASHHVMHRRDRLSISIPRLQTWLGQAGWETAALSSNANILPTWGFLWGFDRFIDVDSGEWLGTSDFQALGDKALALIEAKADRPLFLYVHDNQPHSPYLPPPRYRELMGTAPEGDPAEYIKEPGDPETLKQARLLYAAEIRNTSDRMQSLFDALRRLGRYRDSLIVVVGDHGEEFGEHGDLFHGKTLFQEQLHVPLLIKPPQGRASPGTIETAVSTVDVAPTLLWLLGLAPPVSLAGRQLPLPGDENDSADLAKADDDILYSELNLGGHQAETAILWPWKYLRVRDGAGHGQWVFDLERDARETRDLAAAHPEVLAKLRSAIERHRARSQRGLGLACVAGQRKAHVRFRLRMHERDVPALQEVGFDLGDRTSSGRGWLDVDLHLRPGRVNPAPLMLFRPRGAARAEPDRDSIHLPDLELDDFEVYLEAVAPADAVEFQDPRSDPLDHASRGEPIDLTQIATDVPPPDLVPGELARCQLFFVGGPQESSTVPSIDPQLRKRLQALGYLHDDED